MREHKIISIGLLIVGAIYYQQASAAVDVVCPQSFTLENGGNTLSLAYCGNLDLNADNNQINRAIIVVHGNSRNADDYMTYVQNAGVMAGGADLTTAIIAPQFLTDRDIAAHSLSSNQLYWSSGGWKKGNTSNSSPYARPFNISSFAVVDEIITHLADELAYPLIKEIVVVGHSAGGQFVHRYAAGGNAQVDLANSRPDLSYRYIVANPSSYLYFTAERAEAGKLDSFVIPDSGSCPEYDDYKYGLQGKNSYMNNVGNQAIKQRYQSRRVVTFLGEDDNNPNDSSMDTGCEATLQGAHRLERGERFFNHAQDYFGSQILGHQSLEKVAGVGHSGRLMFQSDCGLALLYGYDPNETDCNGSSGSNVVPTAAFSSLVSGLTVNFTDNSTDSDGFIVSWSWNFGDGNSSINTNPSHTYGAAGSYMVALTVTDNDGGSDSSSDNVTVTESVSQMPTAPSGLTATVEKSGKGKNKVVTGITLNWMDNSDNEAGFVVEGCKEEETGKGKNKIVICNFSEIGNVGTDAISLGLVVLSNDHFRVKAVNGAGSSAYSNEVKANL